MGKTSAGPRQAPPTTWLREAKFRRGQLAPLAYDLGLRQVNNRDLRNTGYQERIRLTQTLTSTHSVAPVSADFFGQYSGMIDRAVLKTQGSGLLFDVSGEGLALISLLDNLYRRDGGASLTPPVSYAYSGTPGTAANTIKMTHDLPIALTNVMNYYSPIGLFQNAVLPTELSLQLFMRPINGSVGVPGSGIWVPGASDVVSGVNGSFNIEQEYYETIPNPNGWPIGNLAHSWREISVPLTADGITYIPFQPNKKVVRVIYWVITGAAGALAGDSTHVTNLALKFSGSNVIYDETVDMVNSRMVREYNLGLPAGVYVHDFISETHTDRDWFDTSIVASPRAELSVTGATYTGGATIKVLFEEITTVLPSGGVAARN